MAWACGLEIISDEQVAVALSNGLDRDLVCKRIDAYDYSIERAITTPRQSRFGNVKKYDYTDADIEHAAVYGINRHTLMMRIIRGAEKGVAMTKPMRRARG